MIRRHQEGKANGLGPVHITLANGFSFRHTLHEFLHAVGLNHPGAHDLGDGTLNYVTRAHYVQDSYEYTIMSYWSEKETGADFNGKSGNSTLQLHDVMALQRLYGANTTTFSDASTYGFGSNIERSQWTVTSDNDAMIGAIWDTGGVDLINLEDSVKGNIIDLREGRFSSTQGLTNNLSIAYGSVIENATGGLWDDTLIGNYVDNVLRGNEGEDQLYGRGGAGDDLIDGGAGRDSMYGGDGWDIVSYRYASQDLDIDLVAGRGRSAGSAHFEVVEEFEQVRSGSGDDLIAGDDATNILQGGGGADTLRGRGGDDDLFGEDGHDTLEGGDGDDRVFGQAGRDYLWGGAGDDVLIGGASNDRFVGGAGLDQMFGGDGVDLVLGNDGDDILRGGNGADSLWGGAGNDWLRGGNGQDFINGGTGRDTLDLTTSSRGFSVDLEAMTAVTFRTIETVQNVEDIAGSAHQDNLLGTDGNNRTDGRGGDDIIGGRNGNDRLTGGGGDDRISGGFGNDIISGGLGLDEMDGGRDIDLIDYSYSGAGWAIDLEAETATRTGGGTESITNFEWVLGAQGDDAILGDSGANLLLGGAGNDSIGGRSGNDFIFGGRGNDDLRGGTGDDLINGGQGIDRMDGREGFDLVDYTRFTTELRIELDAERATFGRFSEVIANFEGAIGGTRADVMIGDDADNRFEGRAGNDALNGFGGNDHLIGGAGSDFIYGGTGADILEGDDLGDYLMGEAGRDILIGGDGEDRFVYYRTNESNFTFGIDILRAHDGGKAFTRGTDVIDLSLIDALSLTFGNDTFTFGGVSPGSVSVSNLNDISVVSAFTDNDRVADLVIWIEDGDRDASSYTADDFIL